MNPGIQTPTWMRILLRRALADDLDEPFSRSAGASPIPQENREETRQRHVSHHFQLNTADLREASSYTTSNETNTDLCPS